MLPSPTVTAHSPARKQSVSDGPRALARTEVLLVIPGQAWNQRPALLVPAVPCPRDREAAAAEGKLLQAAFGEQQKNSTTTRQLLLLILSSYTVMTRNRTICHRGVVQVHQGLSNHCFLPPKFGHVRHLSILCFVTLMGIVQPSVSEEIPVVL